VKGKKVDKEKSPIFPSCTKNEGIIFFFYYTICSFCSLIIFSFPFARAEENDALDKLLTTNSKNFNLDCYNSITFFFFVALISVTFLI